MATHLNLPSPTSTSRPGTSSYSGFILDSPPSSTTSQDRHQRHTDHSDSDYDSDEPLPFPEALARRDFLTPAFDPASYLSALHASGARHQTLEDLRAELRDRSVAVSAELLELVNSNYTSFLGLGDELRGGEDRVEDVRVALLGFRRAVEDVQGKVRERRVEVGRLNEELGEVRGAVEMGRGLLELDERVAGIEERLAVGGFSSREGGEDEDEDDGWDAGDFDDDEEELGNADGDGETGAVFVGSNPGKLAALAREYVRVGRLADSLGRDVPFVRKIEERMSRCRNTILLDLNTALKEARKLGPNAQGRALKFLAIYRTLDAQAEAVRILKEK